MQLKIQRSQRTGVLGAAIFCLDVRADYSADERADIAKYRLTSQIVYSSLNARKHALNASAHLDRVQNDGVGEKAAGLARGALSAALSKLSLNVSIGSLGKGHHIECKDLEELLETEEILRVSCRNLTKYLDLAATFNGSEVVIGYEKGEERVTITQNAPALLEYRADANDGSATSSRGSAVYAGGNQYYMSFGEGIASFWRDFETHALVWCETRGMKGTVGQIRIACGAVALLVLFILYRIL